MDGCFSDPCMNGGTCTTSPNGNFNCTCIYGYSGLNCHECMLMLYTVYIFIVKTNFLKKNLKYLILLCYFVEIQNIKFTRKRFEVLEVEINQKIYIFDISWPG